MKKIIIPIILVLFLTSFIFAQDNTNQIGNDGQQKNAISSSDIDSKNLTKDQIKNIITTRNRIRAATQSGECPERCTCEGSVTRCQLRNGTREMVVAAGESGKTIIMVRGSNISTKIALYNSEDGELYGVFRNNETRIIRVLPDEVQDKIKERIKTRLENQTIELDEDGVYQIEAEKRARLFGFIRVRERVRTEINSETGEIVSVKTPWWGFLARDETEEGSE